MMLLISFKSTFLIFQFMVLLVITSHSQGIGKLLLYSFLYSVNKVRISSIDGPIIFIYKYWYTYIYYFSFPPPEERDIWSRFSVQWLYDTISDQWQRLMDQPLPSSSRYAGCYSILIRPKFRIISINTNYCYKFNWYGIVLLINFLHIL